MTTARNFTKGRLRSPQVIWLHTMETPETVGRADQVARWFAGKTAPQASCHFCVDDQLIVRSVDDGDTAWGVPNGNSFGLHIEMSGMASQTKANWADKYSLGVISNASKVSALWAKKYSFTIQHLTIEQLQAIKNGDTKTTGIAGHVDGSHAFGTDGGHTDPGQSFPYTYFLQQVTQELAKLK